MRAKTTAVYYPAPGGHQALAYTGTSAASTALGAQTDFVVLYATSDCHVNFEGTATTADFFLPGAQLVAFHCRGNQQIRAIQASTSGTLHINEVTL